MNTNTPQKLFLISIIVALIASCSAEQETEQAAEAEEFFLEDSNWQLVRLQVLGGFEFVPDEPGKYVLNFRSENRLTGTSDCNSLSGSWFQEGSAMRFEPFNSSRKLCPPGSLHNNLVLYLRNATAFTINGENMLVSTATEGIEIEFEAR